MLCVDWQDSSNGEGGWLVTGCSNGTVGVSWVDNKEAVVRSRNSSIREEEENPGLAADEEESERGGEGERTNKLGRVQREDNLACTKEACLYKSHFILRSHTGEVSTIH